MSVPLTASPSSVFLTTLYSHEAAPTSRRGPVTASTVRPLKSARTTDAAFAILAFKSATTSSLTARSIVLPLKKRPPADRGRRFSERLLFVTNHRLGR